ncbi:hypothetical protein JQ581_24455 [Bradyrhizobium liaoningense]|uniref:hypothetical protein n=1 Tax=Bradyrhizobium liaoningense TaxID=43992 RepID=UPI001BA5E44C|nr:hypothetical protein [Bradyrhizobium liaoningense]MBR0740089.1 hypothetical protein [Bradyrhizobium liaoningense]
MTGSTGHQAVRTLPFADAAAAGILNIRFRNSIAPSIAEFELRSGVCRARSGRI